MAKQLLLNILGDTLGQFVDGISAENLKLGIWSGKIQMFNLQLKKTALDGLNLPLSVSSGSLKKLIVRIPWAHLETKAVKVEIDGVYLQAGPLDISTISSDELKRNALHSKRARLKIADNLAYKRMLNAQEDANQNSLQTKVKNTTYIQQLTLKIIDNLEITLTNVHIRYEDNLTIPNKVFSFGFTISLIELTSTDENWAESFVKRDLKKDSRGEHEMRKLGKMENFGIYWDVDAEALKDLPSSTWEASMASIVVPAISSSIGAVGEDSPVPLKDGGSLSPLHQSSSGKMPLHAKKNVLSSSDPNVLPQKKILPDKSYLLEPNNNLTVKILHQTMSNANTPMVDVLVESSLVPFDLDKQQLKQIKATGNNL
jgi:vacuolar protein sorting-associated protein 13A/C